jgi:hypothetical protein
VKPININMRILITIAFLLTGSLSINCRATETEPDNGTITGRIIDNNDSQPISFASVALLSASDTNIITGVITDDNGSFQLNGVPYGKYSLKISFLGYKPVMVTNIELSKQNRKVDLQEMKLSEDVAMLSEAVIVEERLKGEEKTDRTVFTLNDDVRKASASGLDVLKHIPSVTVDFMENVTLEGQSNIQFYVDGVLRNKEFIAQLDPGLIDKVELITNPGVKYDSDISGVINIVLKKIKRYGVNGSFKVPVSLPTKMVINPGANIEYGNQKFRIYAGDRLHLERFKGKESLFTDVDESYSYPYRYEKVGEGFNSWQNNYMNYGVDWFVDDKTSLNFMGEWRRYRGTSDDYKSESATFEDNALAEYVRTAKNNLDNSDNYYFSLFFKRKFDKEGTELTAEAYFYQLAGKTKNDYADSYMDTNDLLMTDHVIFRNDLTNNQRNNTEFKLDYSFNLKSIRNEMGLRSFASWTNNEFIDNYSMESVSLSTDDKFQYQENRQAAYYNVSGKIKKFTWQLGVRGEYTRLDINKESSSDYFVLLPQVNLNRNFEKDQSIKLSYRKQIYRPNVSSLNPFEVWSDSLHVRTGNPDLEPTVENRFELSYSKNFKTNYVSPKIYLRYTSNGIQDITRITDNGITEISQGNIGENMEYGIGLSTAVQIMKRWRFNGNITVYDRIYKSDLDPSLTDKQERWSYRFDCSNIISLPKDFNLMLMANYGSPRISYQRTFYRDALVIFGIQKKLSEHASIEGFYVPFIKNFTYTKVVTESQGYHEEWKGQVDVRQLFALEFNYNFNYGKKINKINRSVEYEKEESKGGL